MLLRNDKVRHHKGLQFKGSERGGLGVIRGLGVRVQILI